MNTIYIMYLHFGMKLTVTYFTLTLFPFVGSMTKLLHLQIKTPIHDYSPHFCYELTNIGGAPLQDVVHP